MALVVPSVHSALPLATLKGSIALKIGTMDDPSFFTPSAAIFTKDKQSFHHISPDIPAFEEMPG